MRASVPNPMARRSRDRLLVEVAEEDPCIGRRLTHFDNVGRFRIFVSQDIRNYESGGTRGDRCYP